jgi:hypothetical protein
VRVEIGHFGPDRNFNAQIRTGCAGSILTGATAPALGPEAPVDPEVGERIQALTGYEPDTATVTAVTAVRPAARNILLTPKTQAAGATAAGLYLDVRFIDEFHFAGPKTRKAPQDGAFRKMLLLVSLSSRRR